MTDPGAGLPAADPPRAPASHECCDSGCDPCVFDLYANAMQAYEAALAGWKSRQSEIPECK